MQCDEVRLALWPEPGPRPLSGESVAAFEHYARCDACQRFFRVQRHLTNRLARLREAVGPPAGLTERVHAAVADEVLAEGAHHRARWLAAGGAALLAAAAALLLMLRPGGGVPQQAVIPLVAEAGRAPGDAAGLTSSEIAELEGWFAAQGYVVQVPDISEAYLVGGRIATVDGTRTAAVVYLFRGRPLTYFALPTADVLGSRLRGDRVIAVSVNHYEVALWIERDQARAVVAAIPRAEVVAVASECRNKAAMRIS